MCDGLKFESEQGGDPVLQPLLRFPEVWNPTLHALELGSATGLTKGTIIPQKPPHDDIRSVGGTRTPSAALHVVTPLWRTGHLLDCRQEVTRFLPVLSKAPGESITRLAAWITKSSLICGDGHDEDTQTKTRAGTNRNTLRHVVVGTGPSSAKRGMTMHSPARSGCGMPIAHPSSDTLKSKVTEPLRPCL
jgi:hypothetical protein